MIPLPAGMRHACLVPCIASGGFGIPFGQLTQSPRTLFCTCSGGREKKRPIGSSRMWRHSSSRIGRRRTKIVRIPMDHRRRRRHPNSVGAEFHFWNTYVLERHAQREGSNAEVLSTFESCRVVSGRFKLAIVCCSLHLPFSLERNAFTQKTVTFLLFCY